MGGLLLGGGAKGMLSPLSNYWGGSPPLPTPMPVFCLDRRFDKPRRFSDVNHNVFIMMT